MSDFPSTAAPARPDTNSVRIGHARLLVLLGLLILALWPHLPAALRRRLTGTDELPASFTAAFADDAPFYAPYVALGLVAGWMLRCFPNRGMRPTPVLRPRAHRPQPARAPPAATCRATNSPEPANPALCDCPATSNFITI